MLVVEELRELERVMSIIALDADYGVREGEERQGLRRLQV